MLKKFYFLIVIVLMSVLVLNGCGKSGNEEPVEPEEGISTAVEDVEKDSNLRETLLYYQDDAGYLVPVMRRIPWEEGIAKAALRKMMDTPQQQEDLMALGLRPLLPAGTVIRGMSIRDGLAKVDFNKAAMDCRDAVSEHNMVQGVVLALTDFPTIDRVQFLFEGKKVERLKYGTYVGEPLKAEDVNLEVAPDADKEGAKVTVFFHSTSPSQYDYLVPVTRIISAPIVSLEAAIEEMLKGPKDEGNLRLDIPAGTELLGVQMNDGVAYVNFSKEFEALSQSPRSNSIVVKAIKMTASQFPEVRDVKILVEGKEYEDADAISVSAFANEY